MSSKERLMTVLVAPHVSEKSATRGREGQPVRVPRAPRLDQAGNQGGGRADVRGQGRARARRERRRQGEALRRPLRAPSDFKKAYVSLAAGQTIDFAGVAK